MLEKRKDDSEAIGKYQGMIVSCVIASLLVWIAPMLIPVLTGQEFGTSLVTPPDILLESNETADNLNPNSIGGRMNALWDLFLWVVRLVLVFGILAGIIMLRLEKALVAGPPGRARSAGSRCALSRALGRASAARPRRARMAGSPAIYTSNAPDG